MDFDLFILILHSFTQLRNLSIAFCKLSVDITEFHTVSITAVSSTMVATVISSIFGMSLVYSRYNKGPRTFSCVTPDVTSLRSAYSLTCLTLHSLSDMMCSLYINSSCQTLSRLR